MPRTTRLFPGDEELGKRDDDHRPGSKRPLATVWRHRRLSLRRNTRKIIMVVAGLVALYFFFKNMPTDLENPSPKPRYTDSDKAGNQDRQRVWSKLDTMTFGGKSEGASKAVDGQASGASAHWFDGPIKFYQLATSLHAIPKLPKLATVVSRNVLFASSSLQSASEMISLACEMASWKRNNVHFALMGRDDISIDDLKDVNGVGEGCNVMFHDARPDFLVESSDSRMEISASAALNHISNFMNPQAVLVDQSEKEDVFFLKALRNQAAKLDRTLIELPPGVAQTLMWLTRLDSASLKAWNKMGIDIIIHAQPSASGSLMRLLTSLQRADYFTSAPPRLTIELPQKVDEPTKAFLGSFTWPPPGVSASAPGSQLILHHRIPQHGLTPEENAIRFLESFWPANPSTSHVLVLSPQVELSPFFFHYLKYAVLEYKYSAASTIDHGNLLGISLDLPSTFLNDTTAFTPPLNTTDGGVIPFLWQAPNSNAALCFGDKWVELHSFVSHSLTSSHNLPTPTTLNDDAVAKIYPSWLEHILRLARARGYYSLYPNLGGDDALATMHNELFQPPEEFLPASKHSPDSAADDALADPEAEWTVDVSQHLSLQHQEAPLASTPLLNLFYPTRPLPSTAELPMLSWQGTAMTRSDMADSAARYHAAFQREMGGCTDADPARARVEADASDLFCFDGDATDDTPEPTPARAATMLSHKGRVRVPTSTVEDATAAPRVLVPAMT
ncbi:MAG: hypothetical protein M1818_006156 [Claussenomyces sp. TS43310]|nr:MAG: hypothetical protein M1818_006156 [Claussenomyces sp. TS43310]